MAVRRNICTCVFVKRECACWGVGGYCSLLPAITSSSVVFHYISLEQQSFITLPFTRMAARAICVSNYTHLQLHPCFTSHWWMKCSITSEMWVCCVCFFFLFFFVCATWEKECMYMFLPDYEKKKGQTDTYSHIHTHAHTYTKLSSHLQCQNPNLLDLMKSKKGIF